jgi:hypothetical protein
MTTLRILWLAEPGPCDASMDDTVYAAALRLAHRAWTAGSISDATFSNNCRSIGLQAGPHSHWYHDLLWIHDAVSLGRRSLVPRHACAQRIDQVLRTIIPP